MAFGFLKGLAKFAGKVVRTGLTVATGGKSDLALKLAKGVLGHGAKPKAHSDLTLADQAAIEKYKPNVKLTTVVGETAMPGLPKAGARAPARARRQRPRAAPAKRAKRPAPAPAKRATAKRPAPAKRSAPRGGLDLKRISAMYQAQGRPGRWIDFVKANANVRKAA